MLKTLGFRRTGKEYALLVKKEKPNLEKFDKSHQVLSSILDSCLPNSYSDFVKLILSHYTISELSGKSIKDKRGGENNIHSRDIEYKGAISSKQKKLLNKC